MGYEDIDHTTFSIGADTQQQQLMLSGSISADSAEQTSGVDSPNQNQEATRLYSNVHTGMAIAAGYTMTMFPPKRSKHGIYLALAQLNFLLHKTMKFMAAIFLQQSISLQTTPS